MISESEAQRARESLAEVLEQIGADEITATDSQRAFIAGAVAALDPQTIEAQSA
jgi:hypothetical protein